MAKRRPKLPRPYVPIGIQLVVAHRQLLEKLNAHHSVPFRSKARSLAFVLSVLGFEKPHLDHDPALGRRHLNAKTGKYTPDANDPNYLVWIEAADHGTKTKVDVREIVKTRNLEDAPEKWRGLAGPKRRRKAVTKKRKASFPKGRKLQSRGFEQGK